MKSNKWSVIGSALVASLLCSVNPGAAEPITSANLGKTIAEYAISLVNKPGLGDGQSTRLIEAALGVTGCKPGKDNVWGRALKDSEKMQMGDIIQFTSFRIGEGRVLKTFVLPPRRTVRLWERTTALGNPDHTAIFLEEKDGKVYVAHQNVDGSPEKSHVRIQGFNSQAFNLAKLNPRMEVSGSFIVYRPELK
jgi:hypothetical protein